MFIGNDIIDVLKWSLVSYTAAGLELHLILINLLLQIEKLCVRKASANIFITNRKVVHEEG